MKFDLSNYVREELTRVSFLLNSNYQKILSNKSKVKKWLDSLPVDWDLSFSEVNNRKVHEKSDLDYDRDYFDDHIIDMVVHGKLQHSDEDIKVEIAWATGMNRNTYSIFVKGEDGVFPKKPNFHHTSLSKMEEFIKREDRESYISNEDIYQAVFVNKESRKKILDHVKTFFEREYPWQTKIKGVSALKNAHGLYFLIKDLDPEEKENIKKVVDKNNLQEKLPTFIKEISKEKGLDASHLKFEVSMGSPATKGFLVKFK